MGAMIISWCFICVFAVLINKLSLQDTGHRVAVIGGSVVLPCSYTEHDLKLQDMDVLWRHNDSETVYDIIKGKVSVTRQNPRYQSRAATFPEEYWSGNFSLKLLNLTHTDAGAFSCFITCLSEPQTIQLIINESTAEKGQNSTEHGNQGPDSSPNQMIISCVVVLLVVVIVIGLVIIARFIYYNKKRSQASFQEVRMAE